MALTNRFWATSLKTTTVNLVVVIVEKSDDQQISRNHPLETMNVCPKFDGKSFNSWNMSVWTKVVEWPINIAIPRTIRNQFSIGFFNMNCTQDPLTLTTKSLIMV